MTTFAMFMKHEPTGGLRLWQISCSGLQQKIFCDFVTNFSHECSRFMLLLLILRGIFDYFRGMEFWGPLVIYVPYSTGRVKLVLWTDCWWLWFVWRNWFRYEMVASNILKHRNGIETKCALSRTTKHHLQNQDLKINFDKREWDISSACYSGGKIAARCSV